MCVFRLWEEVKVPGGNPQRHEEFAHLALKVPTQEPFCCEATMLTPHHNSIQCLYNVSLNSIK